MTALAKVIPYTQKHWLEGADLDALIAAGEVVHEELGKLSRVCFKDVRDQRRTIIVLRTPLGDTPQFWRTIYNPAHRSHADGLYELHRVVMRERVVIDYVPIEEGA